MEYRRFKLEPSVSREVSLTVFYSVSAIMSRPYFFLRPFDKTVE